MITVLELNKFSISTLERDVSVVEELASMLTSPGQHIDNSILPQRVLLHCMFLIDEILQGTTSSSNEWSGRRSKASCR
jgi:hypothetical protein